MAAKETTTKDQINESEEKNLIISKISSFYFRNFPLFYDNDDDDYRRRKKDHLILMCGTVSFFTYNLHMSLDRGLYSIIPSSLIGPKSLNLILLTSHIGLGHHIYKQMFRTMSSERKATPCFIYTCYITVLHNFGSFLSTLLCSNALPKLNIIRCLFCLMVSYANITIGGNVLKLLT